MLNKDRKIGLIWIFSPVLLLATAFSLTIISSILSIIPYTYSHIIEIIAGSLGLLAVLAVFIGIPIGVIYLRKVDINRTFIFNEKSVNKKLSFVYILIYIHIVLIVLKTIIYIGLKLFIIIPLVNVIAWLLIGYFLKKKKKIACRIAVIYSGCIVFNAFFLMFVSLLKIAPFIKNYLVIFLMDIPIMVVFWLLTSHDVKQFFKSKK